MVNFLISIAQKLNIAIVLCWLNKIPLYHRNVWWNITCHMHDVKYPIVFDKDNRYIECVVGQEIKMGKTKYGDDILYKVIKVWKSKGSDWLYDSDAYNCNLKFSRIVNSKIKIMVYSLNEAMNWFLSNSSGSVICKKGNAQKECNSYPEAEEFYNNKITNI